MTFGNVKVDTITSSTRTISVDAIFAGNNGNAVTFVAASGVAPLFVSGSPIASSGTLTISLDQSALSIAPSQLTSGTLPSGITIASANIVDGTIVDADISNSASISPAKISGIAVVSGDARLSDARTPVDGSVTNAKVASGAAIELSKLATGALPSGITVASANIVDGTIVNADISNSASIDPAKINGVAVVSGDSRLSDERTPVNGSVTNAKVASGAAIELGKLATGALPSGITVASANIVDGTIANADINVSAAIELSKLANGTLPSGIVLSPSNIGTTSGTVAAGDDARFHSAVTLAASVADVLNLAGQELGADDPGGDRLLFWDDSESKATHLSVGPGIAFDGTTLRVEEWLWVACSDETTALTTGAAKITFRMPFAATLLAVRASVTTAPVGANLVVDINEAGASVISTKLSIDAAEKTSTTAATPAVISDSALADDAEMTIDIDQVGSSTAGAGLKVGLYVRRV